MPATHNDQKDQQHNNVILRSIESNQIEDGSKDLLPPAYPLNFLPDEDDMPLSLRKFHGDKDKNIILTTTQVDDYGLRIRL
jgi:hypothetical protein